MQILIWILKFSLYSLLGILGLFLVLVIVLLVAPIRYQIYFEKYESLAYEVTFRYLYGIKGCFKLEEGKKEDKIKIFWKTVYRNLSDEISEEKEPLAKSENENSKALKKKERVTKASAKALNHQNAVDNQTNSKQKKAKPIKEDEKKSFDWTIFKERWIYDGLKEVIVLIKNLFIKLKPKSFSFELVIGEEDPADTGKLIAKLTMLFPLYYKYGVIRGDYEKNCKQGGFLAEGKIRIGTLIKCFIVFLTKKSVRKMIKYVIKR